MLAIAELPISPTVAVFIASAAAIAFAGTKLSRVADALADRTGMGEIVAGALFVGAATSLPGAITSMTTAALGAAGLAIGNALGGLRAQTAFLAVAASSTGVPISSMPLQAQRASRRAFSWSRSSRCL